MVKSLRDQFNELNDLFEIARDLQSLIAKVEHLPKSAMRNFILTRAKSLLSSDVLSDVRTANNDSCESPQPDDTVSKTTVSVGVDSSPDLSGEPSDDIPF